MPRPPKHITSIRLLRKATRMTQPEFGRLIGLGSESIKSLELGRQKLTEENLIRIASATGVDSDSLASNAGPTFNGLPYTNESWVTFQKRIALPVSDEHLYVRWHSLSSQIKCWLAAARDVNRFHQFGLAVNQTLAKLAREFKIDKKAFRYGEDLVDEIGMEKCLMGELAGDYTIDRSVNIVNAENYIVTGLKRVRNDATPPLEKCFKKTTK